MSEPFIGEIKLVGFNFPPRSWATCDGQLLAISQNQALFSLLGTIYGGDGRTTFALPDMRGRSPMHAGTGPGLTPRSMGEGGGAETTTLAEANLPAHTHGGRVVCSRNEGDREDPDGAFPAVTEAPNQPYHGDGGVTMADGSVEVDPTGSGSPFNTLHPYRVVNFVIALVGIYPSRN